MKYGHKKLLGMLINSKSDYISHYIVELGKPYSNKEHLFQWFLQAAPAKVWTYSLNNCISHSKFSDSLFQLHARRTVRLLDGKYPHFYGAEDKNIILQIYPQIYDYTGRFLALIKIKFPMLSEQFTNFLKERSE